MGITTGRYTSPQDIHRIVATTVAASPATRRKLIGTPRQKSGSNDRIGYCNDYGTSALGAALFSLGCRGVGERMPGRELLRRLCPLQSFQQHSPRRSQRKNALTINA